MHILVMEEIFVSHPIPFLFLLLFLLAIQDVVSPPPKIGRFHSEFSVKEIFTDNHNWDRYYYFHRQEIRQVEKGEVEKMMSCKGPDRGCYVYYCPKCEEYHDILLGCNSRLCSDCGKRYTDQWAKTLGSRMFDVPHRDAVMTLPDRLRPVLSKHRNLWKVVMDSAIKALNDTLSYALRKEVLAGAIIVPHPLIDRLFKDYPEGFYVFAPKESRITSRHRVSKYVARYVRHPAIANSRICAYDGKEVTFWYADRDGIKV